LSYASNTEHGVDPMKSGVAQFEELFDSYIADSGNARSIDSASPTIRPGGIAVLVGMGGNRLELPIALMQHREITLTGTFRYVNTWPDAIALIASGKVDVDSLITGRYGLGDVEEALVKAKTDPLAIKTMVIPGQGEPAEAWRVMTGPNFMLALPPRRVAGAATVFERSVLSPERCLCSRGGETVRPLCTRRRPRAPCR